MAKKGNPFEQDDGLQSRILDPVGPIWKQIIPGPSVDGNPPAQSQFSTGRNCPKCAGQLTFFEYHEESNVVIVKCSGTCRLTFHLPDLEPHDEETTPHKFDNILFRQIPEDLVQRWMDARENEKKRNGEWT